MKIKLRPYQKDTVDNILSELEKVQKVLSVLPTGAGKSIVIGHLGNILEGRTLILTHRVEILKQNSEWLEKVGVLTSKRNTVSKKSKVVIAMVQTLFPRIKKHGIEYLGHFDNIILDEVHVQIFDKVYSQYDYKKLIGFTATPVLNKKRTILIDDVEFIEKVTLSESFDSLVEGVTVNELIDMGYLVRDVNITLNLPNFDKLKPSSSQPDGYTNQSLNEVYNNRVSLEVLEKAISDYCKGKKTLIFNSTTDSNIYVYNSLVELGLNVRMFDSVNSRETERLEIIEWYKESENAILIGTNVFTTGFNVPDVEVVIVNRATKSLALWIQMVGRGSRITDKLFKDTFTVLDLGQNILEHGIWSKERNWMEYFYPSPPKRKNKADMVSVWECPECYCFNLKGDLVCVDCGYKKSNTSGGMNKQDKIGTFEVVTQLPLPKAKTIIDYTVRSGKDANFAFKVLELRMLELFIHNHVTKQFYLERQDDFKARARNIYRPIYFAIIKSGLDGANKKLETQLLKMTNKIDKYYGIE